MTLNYMTKLNRCFAIVPPTEYTPEIANTAVVIAIYTAANRVLK